MNQVFGKIKNGKLIIAPQIVIRDGNINFDNTSLYEEKGYKKLVYSQPLENKVGFDLATQWEEREDAIVQKWEYKEIGSDYSEELLVAVKNFDEYINCLKIEIRNNYRNNQEHIRKFFEKESLIKDIYTYKDDAITTKQLLEKLSEYKLNMIKFFEWLKMKEFIEKKNLIIEELFLIDKSKEIDGMSKDNILDKDVKETSNKEKEFMGKCIVWPMYFKSNLSYLYALEKNETASNNIMYNMAFIYLFTLFDEILLKIIRIICMHERKWLFGTENLSAEEIMKCDTVEELQIMLVNKKVNKLAWGRYDDKIKFLKKRGVIIDEKHISLFYEDILFLSLKRNVLVHNGGVWNKDSVNMLKGTRYYGTISIGDDIIRTYESFENASEYIKSAIKYLYNQLCEKFNLIDKY